MNARGREVLRHAAMTGVRQVRGSYAVGPARCAMGVLFDAVPLNLVCKRYSPFAIECARLGAVAIYALDLHPVLCPVCSKEARNETNLIAHLNDEHALDFLGIAEKCPDSEPAAQ